MKGLKVAIGLFSLVIGVSLISGCTHLSANQNNSSQSDNDEAVAFCQPGKVSDVCPGDYMWSNNH